MKGSWQGIRKKKAGATSERKLLKGFELERNKNRAAF